MPVNKPKAGPNAKGSAKTPKEAHKKKATKGKNRGMRNTGKLAQLFEMPNEIFFMVVSRVSQPLLRLADGTQ